MIMFDRTCLCFIVVIIAFIQAQQSFNDVPLGQLTDLINITTQNYQDLDISLSAIVGPDITEQMANSITNDVFEKKIAALGKLVKAAENFSALHKPEKSLQPADVIGAKKFYNAKDENLDTILNLTHSSLFNKDVSFYESTVHVPTEIYIGDNKVLNGIVWSDQLKDTFIQNQKDDDALLWQYFGSQDGFLRSFPGSQWNEKGVDLYDARRRPWYAQGSSSPKDMLILIDSSGSTMGQVSYLMKLTVRTLLETLGEDDFVMVARYADTATKVSPCFDSFVQANSMNKKILNDDVARIKPDNKSDYNVALKFAFTEFEKLHARRSQENCHSLIMILTDGGTEKPEELFQKHDPNGTKYRVFTYAIGQSPSNEGVMKWLACEHRGYFSKIESIGAIRPSVQHYEVVIAKPVGPPNSNPVEETAAFRQELAMGHVLAPRASGLASSPQMKQPHSEGLGSGMLTTLTKPVFDQKSSKLLGVMAVDISIEELMTKAPYSELSDSGYAFAINHNGYVIFHPWLKEQERWQKDPPNIDLEDLEYQNCTEPDHCTPYPTMTKLRNQMINATDLVKDDAFSITRRYKAESKQVYHREEQITFSYKKVNRSSFSLGIAIPDFLTLKPNFTSAKTNYTEAEDVLKGFEKNTTFIDVRKYSDSVTALLDSESLTEFAELLTGNMTEASRHLLTDVQVVNKLQLEEGSFVSTAGGLLKVSSSTNISNVNDGGLWTDNRKEAYSKYQQLTQLVHASGNKTLFIGADDCSEHIRVLKRVAIQKDDANQTHTYIPAVIGVSVPIQEYETWLEGMCNETLTNSSTCYLLNEGGYVIADTKPCDGSKSNLCCKNHTNAGGFFGKIDSHLMHLLINESIFTSKKYLDFQGVCKETDFPAAPSSASRRLFSVLWTLYQAIVWQLGTLSQLYTGIYNVLFSTAMVDVGAEEIVVNVKNVTCVRESYSYQFQEGNIQENATQNRSYKDLSREFRIVPISGTNLLFLEASDLGEDDEDYQQSERVPHDPTPDQDSTLCSKEGRYRKAPVGPCNPIDKNEKHSACGVDFIKLDLFCLLLVILKCFL